MSAHDLVCQACGTGVFSIDVHCGQCGAALSSDGAQRMIGTVVLDHYRITDVLGQGGMSVVYRGKHDLTGQEVALKVLPPELAAYRDVKSRFLEEGRALAQLDHPNIVHLYNFGDDGDRLVLAMQFVRGETWERLILEQEVLPWEQSIRYTIDVSNALSYAHGRGIVHRDMKPSNVLIRELDGAATVMDFGIAKMQSSDKLTATGQTMGTVRYMSPEQVRGKGVDERTDIYSLAITAYESIIGDTPFTGETHFEIMSKHLNEEPPALSSHGIEVPVDLERVLMRALSKDPALRQASAGEFKEQLEAVIAGQAPRLAPLAKKTKVIGGPKSKTPPPVGAFPTASVTTRKPRASKGVMVAGMGAAVAIAGVVTIIATRSKGESKPTAAARSENTARDGATGANADPLAGAFMLPGTIFAIDQTFPDDKLRILSVQARDVEEVRSNIDTSWNRYQRLGEEQGWIVERLPLSLHLVPPSAICNPQLYRDGVAQDGCDNEEAWYRAGERSLYLVPKADPQALQEQLDYWVAIAACIHNETANCYDVIQQELDPQ